MRIELRISVVLCIIFLFSCKCKESEKLIIEVEKSYSQRNITFDRNLKKCLILPEVGCEGCIAAGVDFFHQNSTYFSRSQRSNMIVFTAISSLKMLYRTLGTDSLEKYNCIIDSENDYLIPGNNAIYPLVLSLENGRIIKAEYQSPFSGDVLECLKNELRNKNENEQ